MDGQRVYSDPQNFQDFSMDEPLNDTMVQLSWILHTRFMSKIYLFYFIAEWAC